MNILVGCEHGLLNYGRILNNVKLQDATFQEFLATYQQSVLTANQDVENGLVTFLRGQERTQHQQASVDAAIQAVNIAVKQYQAGTTDFTTVTQVEQIQVQQQDLLAQAEGEIATGLITVYRALGGGWEIRLHGCDEQLPYPNVMNSQPQPETVPAPNPAPLELPKPDAPYSVKPLPQPHVASDSEKIFSPNVPTFASAVAAANYRSEQYSPHPAPANSASNSSPAVQPEILPTAYPLNLESADSIVPASATVSESLQFEMPVSTRPATSPMMHYSLPQDAAHAPSGQR